MTHTCTLICLETHIVWSWSTDTSHTHILDLINQRYRAIYYHILDFKHAQAQPPLVKRHLGIYEFQVRYAGPKCLHKRWRCPKFKEKRAMEGASINPVLLTRDTRAATLSPQPKQLRDTRETTTILIVAAHGCLSNGFGKNKYGLAGLGLMFDFERDVL